MSTLGFQAIRSFSCLACLLLVPGFAQDFHPLHRIGELYQNRQHDQLASSNSAALDAQAAEIIRDLHRHAQAPECDCSDVSLCQPIQVQHDKEMFGFIYPASKNFRQYNWTRLTTVAWLEDPELVCLAHGRSARVVMNAANISDGMLNNHARSMWVRQTVQHVLDHALDGVNFDYETAMARGSAESYAYTHLVALTARVLRALNPGYQVSVDVPWSPYGVDGRDYDWEGLTAAVDIMFIMSYDMQSQVWGRCVASANTPLPLMRRGLDQWLQLGTPRSKMVLGLPWYGYDYPCEADRHGDAAGADIDVCLLAPQPFHGATCSDAAGAQRPYAQLSRWVREGLNTTPMTWDAVQSAVSFNYWSVDDNKAHQVWFDTPESLLLRYRVAHELGLRGVGCWNLEWLFDGPDFTPAAGMEMQSMWLSVDQGFFATRT